MVNSRFTYNEKDLTALIVDQVKNFVWLAYAKNTSGNCIIKKLFGFLPTQVFYNIERAVDNINDIAIDTNNVYMAYNDTTLLGEIFVQNTPLSNFTSIDRPLGIVENPIALAVNTTHIFFLLPGSISGTNAKLIQYTLSGVFVQIIDLTNMSNTVTDASTITIDASDNIWLSTNTNPITLVKVFEISGGAFDFVVTP